MKKIACLFSLYLLFALALVACSESENIAEVDDGSAQDLSSEESSSSLLASSATETVVESGEKTQEGNSSSLLLSSAAEKAPKSSSSVSGVSSGNVQDVSSVSNYLDFLDEEMVSSGYGCGGGAGGAAGAVGGAGGAGGLSGFVVDSSSLANFPYLNIIKARTEKLVSIGVAKADAEKKAKEELVATLGLDTLFRKNPLQGTFAIFTRSNVEYALNFFFAHDTVAVREVIKTFSEKGTFDPSSYCGIWNSTTRVIRTEATSDFPYAKVSAWASSAAERGCAMTGYEIYPPTYIFSNVFRKCIGLPYCSDKLFGTIKRAGLNGIIGDTLYFCNTNGWTFLANFNDDTKDVPCDEIGKMFKSLSVNERYYVCKDDGWNVASKMDYEVKDIPCGDSAKLVKSPTDTTKYYLCKNSKWKIADQMEISTTNVPCDRVGKIVDSGTKDYKGRIFYICRDTGWDVATQREADIGDRACDVEGKTVNGLVDTIMSYVCYQNSWVDFYDAPCDTDNKRVRDWKEGLKEDYICYNGKWNYSRKWSCEYSKEYYLNPSVKYGTLVDERDGDVYKTVEVNGYTWMAENLRYVPEDVSQSVPVQEGCDIAGQFYSKEAARTACPAGWKLPDSVVVSSLEKGYDRLSGYLQNCFNQQFLSQIGSICSGFECNVYGTSFLPLGTKNNPASHDAPNDTYYWACSKQNPEEAWLFKIGFNSMLCFKTDVDDFMPIRCVKDK